MWNEAGDLEFTTFAGGTMMTRALSVFGVAMLCCSIASGQVFTQADGAVEGITGQGDGQALYGGFGLNSATAPEYNIYRKYLQVADENPLSSATNVDGNPGEVEWINVNQRQSGNLAGEPSNVLTAPGMFIGENNHKTEDGWVVSDPNQVLYFRPLVDNSGDVGSEDSNSYVQWDTRFGFMENPDDFIDFVEPNSEQLDLWTGDFRTDAVYMQVAINRDDTASDEVRTTTGHGGSFKLQSGLSSLNHEGSRRNWETERSQAGTDEELERTGLSEAGVAYNDPIEVTWGMRLNDPENEDEIFAREVEFWVKTGNIITSGIFDPGGGDDGDFPDLTPNDDGEDFSDLLFDWENAKPVFFAGAQGLAQGTGGMGIFIPGDFGANGAVDVDDFNRLAADFGNEGTTYSRGDFTQDGITNIDDATAWAGLADDAAKSAAVGAIEADVAAGGSLYDFDGSGSTDAADVTLISDLFGVGGGDVCTPSNGDIDGNGNVEFADFLILSANFGMDADGPGGDIDCDGTVAFADFLILSDNFGQAVGAAAVPEPSGHTLLMLASMVGLFVRQSRKRAS